MAIFGFIFLLGLMNIPRGIQSRSSWKRTTGKIKNFGVSYGTAEVTYDYDVDGQTLTSSGIVPGPIAGYQSGIRVPKSVYLNPDGTLKFPPGSETTVYYNPARPNDAVLIPGISPGLWKGLLFPLIFAGLIWMGYQHWPWVEKRALLFFGALFTAASIWIFCYGLACNGRYRRTRAFPSTHGTLLKAEVVFSQGNGQNNSGGFVPSVQFEYEVNGQLFQSRQFPALNARAMQNKPQKVQARLDALKEQKPLVVFYDAVAPWDAFLEHGPKWGAFAPMLMAIPFFAFGLFALLKHSH